jgi:hypothetical protein
VQVTTEFSLSPVVLGEGVLSQSFYDVPLKDLSPTVRSAIQQQQRTLFQSIQFGESYCSPSAERVAYLVGSDGRVMDWCCYREKRLLGVGKNIEVVTSLDPNGDLALELRKLYPKAAITFHFLNAELSAANGFRAMSSKVHADDSIIDLPRTGDEYLKGLGRTTRKHLPYYLRRINKEWGSRWSLSARYGKQIHKSHYLRLIELNSLRIQRRGLRSGWKLEIAEQRWTLFQDCGTLCSLLLDDLIVAGTMCVSVQNRVYLILIAHDPQFDRLNIGNLTLWFTIQHFIAQEMAQFHLMWGNSFYKQQFGGRRIEYQTAQYFPTTAAAVLSKLAALMSFTATVSKRMILGSYDRLVGANRLIGKAPQSARPRTSIQH